MEPHAQKRNIIVLNYSASRVFLSDVCAFFGGDFDAMLYARQVVGTPFHLETYHALTTIRAFAMMPSDIVVYFFSIQGTRDSIHPRIRISEAV